jgi:hypothetical protein
LSATRVSDPDVLPPSPYISLKDARRFASTLIESDLNERGIISRSMREIS